MDWQTSKFEAVCKRFFLNKKIQGNIGPVFILGKMRSQIGLAQ